MSLPIHRGEDTYTKAIRQNLHKGNTQIQLFDLAKDLSEKTDVAAQHPAVVERMLGIMRGQHTASGLYPFKALDGK